MLLVPCDAFNLTKKGITQLTKLSDCIPLDERGIRQPLHENLSAAAAKLGGEFNKRIIRKFPKR